MRKKNYKFTNKKHPPRAIASTILGLISLFGMGGAIYKSFLAHGVTKPGYGLTGLLAVIFSIIGIVLGVLSLKENDSFHVFGWGGIILNLLVLVGTAYLFSIGLKS